MLDFTTSQHLSTYLQMLREEYEDSKLLETKFTMFDNELSKWKNFSRGLSRFDVFNLICVYFTL